MSGIKFFKSYSLGGDQHSEPKKTRRKHKSVNTFEKSSWHHQYIAWISLQKCINDLVHNVNEKNIKDVWRYVINLNIVRGRGLFCQSIIEHQVVSIEKSHIYASLVSLINADFPNVGELLVSRCLILFKKAYAQKALIQCSEKVILLAHLINRSVVFTNLGLEMIRLFLISRNEVSIELAFELINICACKLFEEKRNEMNALLELMCYIFYKEQLNTNAHYRIIAKLTAASNCTKKRSKFNVNDLLPRYKVQFTHEITWRFTDDGYDFLDDFDLDPDYIANEKIYKQYALEILEPEIRLYNSRMVNDADDEGDNEEETAMNSETL